MTTCDKEFKLLLNQVGDLNIQMNYTKTDDHVPEAEHNNQDIVECIHATYHKLPYNDITKIMIKYLVVVCTNQLTLFAEGGSE